MEALLKIAHRIDRINDRIGKLTSLLLIVMVTVGALNVIASELGELLSLKLTSNRYLELQWYLYGIIFLLGSAYTLKQNDHVRVDVFYNGWSAKRKAWANLLGSLLFLIPFSSLIITTAFPKVIRSWQRGEMSPDADGLLRAPIKTVVIIGFALLILQGLSEAIKSAAIIREHPLPPGMTAELPNDLPAEEDN